MSLNITLNGNTYAFPTNLETNWGTVVTSWAQAVSNSTLQKTGGNFTLTAEVDFGASFGLKSAYFKSRSANPASAGTLRLSNIDVLAFRNTANAADLSFGVNTSDQLVFNGNPLFGSAALTANRALVSDSAGLVSVSAVTSVELGYLSGVTSAIQTQLDAKALNSDLTAHTTATSGAHAASAISNTASGNLVATTVQGALNELQTDVDTRATSASLTAHASTASSVHGVTGNLVGTSDIQTLTNKTLTSPVISSISNIGTISVPTANDTLVGRLTTDTLTNKSISGSNNTITNVPLTSAVTGVLPNVNGGTGTGTFATGDVLYASASNTLSKLAIGSNGNIFKVVAGIPGWASPSASSLGISSKSASYSLTTSDDVILFTAAATATLPTAVGNDGKVFTIINNSATSVNVTIATTSSQTIGKRASGDIILSRLNNNIQVVSDGANWVIIDKNEHQVLTASSGQGINGPNGSYQGSSPSVTLGIGIWDITAWVALNVTSGAASISVGFQTGFFGASGANSTTAPIAFGGIIDGPSTYNSLSGGGTYNPTPQYGASAGNFILSPIISRAIVTSGTQPLYMVVAMNYATAASTTQIATIVARRVW